MIFLCNPFTLSEVIGAITKLNSGKAPGMDNITAEHLKYGGILVLVSQTLLILYNWILQLEFIPSNFREGIQVPLHKEKNTTVTGPDNFRGITLLNTYSKVFEILVWNRMESWWMNKITPLQGASRKGVSCLHTAMMLQDTVSSNLESRSKVFVTYFDVSKAFDSVWVNGLFYQLRHLGIIGVTWRIMDKMYVDF